MRIATFFALVVLLANGVAAGDPYLPPPPDKWDPKYWDGMTKVAHNARDRGDRHNAERLCAVVLPYVDKNVQRELDNYANALAQKNDERSTTARANAQRYAEIQELQAHATEPIKTSLGFKPFDQLNAYADFLAQQRREKDAERIRVLAIAQRQSQQAYFNRTQLIQQGKDPQGEC